VFIIAAFVSDTGNCVHSRLNILLVVFVAADLSIKKEKNVFAENAVSYFAVHCYLQGHKYILEMKDLPRVQALVLRGVTVYLPNLAVSLHSANLSSDTWVHVPNLFRCLVCLKMVLRSIWTRLHSPLKRRACLSMMEPGLFIC